MGGEEHLGEFEHLVLLAILRLQDDAYAVTIRDEITRHAERPVSFGAVYSTLRRLEGKGYVSSSVGGAEPVRGGRAKKYVRVEPAGLEAVRRSQERIARMSAGVAALEGTGGGG